jgi:hypothetical protein
MAKQGRDVQEADKGPVCTYPLFLTKISSHLNNEVVILLLRAGTPEISANSIPNFKELAS